LNEEPKKTMRGILVHTKLSDSTTRLKKAGDYTTGLKVAAE
jgi:hypothetical protein